MSEDVNPAPTNEPEPTLPPRRAVPERIEPITEDDLLMEDLLADVDTISVAQQEELAGGNLAGVSSDNEPAEDESVQIEDSAQDDEPAVNDEPALEAEGALRELDAPEMTDAGSQEEHIPVAEQPIAFSDMAEGETTVITPVPEAEESFYVPSVEPLYPAATETAVLAPAPVVAAPVPDNGEGDEPDADEDVAPRSDRGTIDFGLFLLRATLGIIMALHGADKLFGLFGGSIASTEQLLHSIGFTNYTELLAIGAGVTELVGGVIVALGLFAPAGASALLGVMGMATLTHLALGDTAFLSSQKGPYEIITLIVVMAATVILAGAGRWSVDGRWGWATRPKWGALVWLVVGIISAPVMWAVLNTQGFPF